MIARILLVSVVAAGLTSCASTYRTGQTPDDVYYSPLRERESYVQVDRDEDNRQNLEDQRLRQQIRDSRFRNYDDFDLVWGTPRYNSWGWNTWNNPYNTWGWNSWNNTNSYWYNTNYYTHGYNWGNPLICIPGSHNVIIIGGSTRSNSTGIRYTPAVSSVTSIPKTSGGKFGTGYGSSGDGRNFNTGSNPGRSRFFSGSSNSGNRTYSGGNSGGSGRTFSSGSSNSGSGRTFSGSSSNSGSSSSSGSSKSSSSGRRN